jgi:hypothetical protein
MFTWRTDILKDKAFLVFEDNPDGTGFGCVQRVQSGGKVLYRWAPLLKDVYQGRAVEDFKIRDDLEGEKRAEAEKQAEAAARRFGIGQIIALLTRFGLRENPL